jgi:hypothetical protein
MDTLTFMAGFFFILCFASVPSFSQGSPNLQEEVDLHSRLAQQYLREARPDLAMPVAAQVSKEGDWRPPRLLRARPRTLAGPAEGKLFGQGTFPDQVPRTDGTSHLPAINDVSMVNESEPTTAVGQKGARGLRAASGR